MIQGYGMGSLVSQELWGLMERLEQFECQQPAAPQGNPEACGFGNAQLGNLWGDLLGSDVPSPGCNASTASSPSSGGSSPSSGGSSPSSSGSCPSPAPSGATEQMPSMHYVAFNAPANVHESTSTQQGPNGEVLTDTTYKDANGNIVYTDNGVWNPSTGILTDDETNGQGQHATVTSQVQGNQIISHVSGDSNVSEYTINFNGDGTNDQTAYMTNGQSQSYHNSSGSGPWGAVNVGNVTADYDQIAHGNTVDAIDLTNAAGTYRSTIL